jgi:hypothetical protein
MFEYHWASGAVQQRADTRASEMAHRRAARLQRLSRGVFDLNERAVSIRCKKT